MSGKYDDIINLPHYVSTTRPHMPMIDRAAQFSPFAALTGYEDAVREAGRLTGRRIELSEDEQALLDIKLRPLLDGSMTGEAVTLTFFQPDKRKTGGDYVTASGTIRRIDSYERTIILTNGMQVLVDDILDVQY